MESFKTFLEQQAFVDQVLNEFDQMGQAQPMQQQKVWSAKKPEIMQMWQNLRPDMPINITPMAKKDAGGGGSSSYGEDGIRITGSWPFIASILGRLKEILGYEGQQTKLRLVFRGVDKSRSSPDKEAFVFYMNVDERGQGRAGRPKKLEVPTI
jgi:hypothetical protein